MYWLWTSNRMCFVNGDCISKHQAEIMVEEHNQKYLLTMAVVEILPVDMLFGQRLLVRESFRSLPNSTEVWVGERGPPVI